MPVLRRLSPALRAYIREEYRRVWTRREYLTLLFAMVAVELLRMAATWFALANQPRPIGSALELLSPLGFTSGIIFSLRFASGVVPGWSWPFWIVGEFLGGLVVLAPYYAGRSIASARKYRDVDDLRARGLSVTDILLGRGLTHLAPFLAAIPVVVLLTLANTVGTLVLTGGRGSRMGVAPFNDPLLIGLQLLLLLIANPLGNMARLATMVCVSALNRRIWGGVAACYGLSLILFPVLGFLLRLGAPAIVVWPAAAAQAFLMQIILPNVLSVVAQVAVFAALLPLARRALAGKPPISLPKMEEPRSLWMDEGDHAALPGE